MYKIVGTTEIVETVKKWERAEILGNEERLKN